ncbi:hypothetical protein [Oceanirhabdus sp. W0125-5]|uniref:hypothetical protein n=1 Tax=Oceanirhabdus sp. W0125-5 TaxID=2999116 RepID=UPI0022F32AC8|nr:hypothetical protein [Oceanirhabdus sp. W0125-5]WBW94935.1 hypothetical protein OW730_14650 [Oceanirhabdus sp. W0125-5]
MWMIKWNIVSRGQKDYLREFFNDGKILKFEFEEDALRFLERLRELNNNKEIFISYTVCRFAGDRKEKYRLVKSTTFERTVEDVIAYINHI